TDTYSGHIGRSMVRDLDLSAGESGEDGLADADGAAVAVSLGNADGDNVDLAFARDISVGRGVPLTISTGVAVTRAIADGVAVVSGVARRTGVAVAAMVAELAGVEVEVALADGAAVAAFGGDDVDVADVSAAASVGFTNVFGGALGGGVASAFI